MKYPILVLVCCTAPLYVGINGEDKKSIETVVHSIKAGDPFDLVFSKIKKYPYRLGDYPSILCYDERKGEYVLLFQRSEKLPSSKYPVVVIIFFANGKSDYDSNGVVVLPAEMKGKKIGLKDLEQKK